MLVQAPRHAATTPTTNDDAHNSYRSRTDNHARSAARRCGPDNNSTSTTPSRSPSTRRHAETESFTRDATDVGGRPFYAFQHISTRPMPGQRVKKSELSCAKPGSVRVSGSTAPRDGESPAPRRGRGFLTIAQPPRLRRRREHSREQKRRPSATRVPSGRCDATSAQRDLPSRFGWS
jgi:hypothetical protein